MLHNSNYISSIIIANYSGWWQSWGAAPQLTKTLSHKLFEMVGTAWILDLLNISDHFAFWTRPLSSLENDVQIFFRYNVKYKAFSLRKKLLAITWTEGPLDLRLTFLRCIFDALFGDTPLDHIFSHMPICPYAHYGHIWGIWAYGHMGICEKYGQVGYPLREHQKCNSETLTSGL